MSSWAPARASSQHPASPSPSPVTPPRIASEPRFCARTSMPTDTTTLWLAPPMQPTAESPPVLHSSTTAAAAHPPCTPRPSTRPPLTLAQDPQPRSSSAPHSPQATSTQMDSQISSSAPPRALRGTTPSSSSLEARADSPPSRTLSPPPRPLDPHGPQSTAARDLALPTTTATVLTTCSSSPTATSSSLALMQHREQPARSQACPAQTACPRTRFASETPLASAPVRSSPCTIHHRPCTRARTPSSSATMRCASRAQSPRRRTICQQRTLHTPAQAPLRQRGSHAMATDTSSSRHRCPIATTAQTSRP
eukprot:comp19936_c0_seq1/m.38825 comp19936_c0_seq1/g.38825  ORF comp19936_c0_seq1/g.38825 comp19936_c0_seq1/m.38825 type:complete len:308 (+) comp19936_c0_seq1:670-1593(+)